MPSPTIPTQFAGRSVVWKWKLPLFEAVVTGVSCHVITASGGAFEPFTSTLPLAIFAEEIVSANAEEPNAERESATARGTKRKSRWDSIPDR